MKNLKIDLNKMKSEILIELEENTREMGILIGQQKFTVGDAQRFLERYSNYVRKIEQLTESRNNWKDKYETLKGRDAS